MEQILRTYGKFLLETVCLGLVLTLLMCGISDDKGNVGVFRMIGAYFTGAQMAEKSDFAVCIQESMRAKPQISYAKSQPVYVGNYNIEELFTATDCDGNRIALKVEGICSPMGIWELDAYQEDEKQISFRNAGVYLVQLYATDAWNQKTACSIHIPVNE